MSSELIVSDINDYNFTAVPLDPKAFLQKYRSTSASPISASALLTLPTTDLSNAILSYARNNLSEPTLNHSLRVYLYGKALASNYFSTLKLSEETFFAACLLHDIGTTEANITSTRLSFEFHGGFIAYNLLHNTLRTPRAQAEAIAEAVIRHQDLGTVGSIMYLGQILQLATILGE